MQPRQETVYYQDASVFISSARAVFFDQTFFTKNISSITINEVEAKDYTPIVLIIAGVILSLAGVVALLSKNLNVLYLSTGVLLILAGIFFFFWGIQKQINSKIHFALTISTFNTQRNIIISENLEYINTLQNALNQSLINNQ